MDKSGKVWFIYALYSTIAVALLLTLMQAAYGQEIKAAEKSIREAYEKDQSLADITGMASGTGKQIGGVAAMLVGIILAINALVVANAGEQFALSAKCYSVVVSSWALPCWAPLVVGILLIIVGIMLLAKGKEVKDKERKEDDSQSFAPQLNQQASVNQN